MPSHACSSLLEGRLDSSHFWSTMVGLGMRFEVRHNMDLKAPAFSSGADVHWAHPSSQETALHLTAQAGHCEAMEFLIARYV